MIHLLCLKSFNIVKTSIGVIPLDNMAKKYGFCRFWVNDPRKWPQWPPGSGYMNQKTIEMDRDDQFRVPEVVQ